MLEFKEIVKEIKSTGKPKRMTVRGLIQSVGKERRGKYVIRSLRNKLRYNGLTTEPDFALVHIDSRVSVKAAPTEEEIVKTVRKLKRRLAGSLGLRRLRKSPSPRRSSAKLFSPSVNFPPPTGSPRL